MPHVSRVQRIRKAWCFMGALSFRNIGSVSARVSPSVMSHQQSNGIVSPPILFPLHSRFNTICFALTALPGNCHAAVIVAIGLASYGGDQCSEQVGVLEEGSREAAQVLVARNDFFVARRRCQMCARTDIAIVSGKEPYQAPAGPWKAADLEVYSIRRGSNVSYPRRMLRAAKEPHLATVPGTGEPRSRRTRPMLRLVNAGEREAHQPVP